MGYKILLADDSITVQKIVKLTFTDEGIDVIAVGNGELALQQLAEWRPDLVMADVFMPLRDGYEVCQQIKSDPAMSHIPVILLVHAFEPFDQAKANAVRADRHLTKPFHSIRTLVNTVKELIEQRPAQQNAAPAPRPVSPEMPVTAPPVQPAAAASAAPVSTPPAPMAFSQANLTSPVAESGGGAVEPLAPMSMEFPVASMTPAVSFAPVQETPLTPASSEPMQPEFPTGATPLSFAAPESLPLSQPGQVFMPEPLESMTPALAPEPDPLFEQPVAFPVAAEIAPPSQPVYDPMPEMYAAPAPPVDSVLETLPAPEAFSLTPEPIAQFPARPEPFAAPDSFFAQTPEPVFASQPLSETIQPAPVSYVAPAQDEVLDLGLSSFDMTDMASEQIPAPAVWDGPSFQVSGNQPSANVSTQPGQGIPDEFSAAPGFATPAAPGLPLASFDQATGYTSSEIPVPAPPVPVAPPAMSFASTPSAGYIAEPASAPYPTDTAAGMIASHVGAEISQFTSLSSISPALMDEIVNRVVERISSTVVQEIAWEVVPDLAELIIRRQLAQKSQ
ncbi:MAG: response regulator [Blastocatellia bacterium]